MAKPKRYAADQITRILKLQESGLRVAEICRQTNVSEQTFYRWKSKYSGMGQADGGKVISRIKTVKTRARGFRKKQRFRHAIYFHLGGLQLYPAGVEG